MNESIATVMYRIHWIDYITHLLSFLNELIKQKKFLLIIFQKRYIFILYHYFNILYLFKPVFYIRQ